MPLLIAQILAYGVIVYFGLGLVFAVAFVVRGVQKIDPAAAAPSFGLRLLWIPGSAAFWPMLLSRWIRGMPPPTEVTAHRASAGRAASGRGRAS